MSRFLTLACCLTIMGSTAATTRARAEAEVQVSMEAAPEEARVGDTIGLEIRVKVSGGSLDDIKIPDLSAFEVVSQQTSRPMQFSFGFGSKNYFSSTTVHTFGLRLLREGTYKLPPAEATVDGKVYQTAPVTIRVHGGVATDDSVSPDDPDLLPDQEPALLSGARIDPQAFLRTVVEPQEVYIGQQVDVTVYLYSRLRISGRSVMPTKPAMDGFWTHEIPINALRGRDVVVGQTTYRAYVIDRSAVFPQRTGTLTIGAPRVVFDTGGGSLFDVPQRVERAGVPIAVVVKPLPEPVPPGAVVGKFTMQASIDRPEVVTGDAITLRVQASGQGNVQDIRLELPKIPNVRALQPAIRDTQSLDQGLLIGERTWEWILIAEGPGASEVPSLELPFFDPATEQYGTAQTAPLAFRSTGGVAQAPAATAPTRDEAPPTAVFGPIRTRSALARAKTPLRREPWFVWLLGLPPLAWVGAWLAAVARQRFRRRQRTASAVQQRFLHEARDALRAGDPRRFYDRIVATLHHALQARLGEPVGGVTQVDLRHMLTQAGCEAGLIDRIANELEGADFARFAASGVDPSEMERCLGRTKAILERLQRPGNAREAS